MRAILIDPTERTIEPIDLPDFTEGIRRRFDGARLVRIGTLPNGDGVHVVVSHPPRHGTFSLGGSGPHRGRGLILGKRGLYGMLKAATTTVESLASIVAFGDPAKSTAIRAIAGTKAHAVD